jgi:HPt (histidine-containing phosphotransfer) domain-containing protein
VPTSRQEDAYVFVGSGNGEVPEMGSATEYMHVAESYPVFDWEGALRRMEGDGELLLEVIELFEEDTPSHLDSLTEAAQCGDDEGLARAAHRLKGAAGNVSACRLEFIARNIESALRRGDVVLGRDLARHIPGLFEAFRQAVTQRD